METHRTVSRMRDDNALKGALTPARTRHNLPHAQDTTCRMHTKTTTPPAATSTHPRCNQESLGEPSLHTYPKNQQMWQWDGSNSKTSNMCHFFTQVRPEPRWSTKLLYRWAEIKVLRHQQIYRNVEWNPQPHLTPQKISTNMKTTS
jgi:hypothetical protein